MDVKKCTAHLMKVYELSQSPQLCDEKAYGFMYGKLKWKLQKYYIST